MEEVKLIPKPDKQKQVKPFTKPDTTPQNQSTTDLAKKHTPTQLEQKLAHTAAATIVTMFNILKTILHTTFQILTAIT